MYEEFEKLLEKEFNEFVGAFDDIDVNMHTVEKALLSGEIEDYMKSIYGVDFKNKFMSELPYHQGLERPQELSLDATDLRTAWMIAIKDTKWYIENKPKRCTNETIVEPALYITELEVHNEQSNEHLANIILEHGSWSIKLINTNMNSNELQIVTNALKYMEVTGMDRNYLND